jgi:HPt (histidine-containing phosphotransfer) domain-containing protein
MTSQSDNAVPGLDLDVLDALVSGDPAKLQKFLMLFISSMEELMQQFEDASTREDLAELIELAQRAKSNALSIGAVTFALHCEQLELAVHQANAARALAMADALQSEFTAICEAIHQRLGF